MQSWHGVSSIYRSIYLSIYISYQHLFPSSPPHSHPLFKSSLHICLRTAFSSLCLPLFHLSILLRMFLPSSCPLLLCSSSMYIFVWHSHPPTSRTHILRQYVYISVWLFDETWNKKLFLPHLEGCCGAHGWYNQTYHLAFGAPYINTLSQTNKHHPTFI